jgi:hypothetical protein
MMTGEMVAWPHIRGRNAASLMIAEKIQLKSGRPTGRGIHFGATSPPASNLLLRHKLLHRGKMPMQNKFHGLGGRPVNCSQNSLELQGF